MGQQSGGPQANGEIKWPIFYNNLNSSLNFSHCRLYSFYFNCHAHFPIPSAILLLGNGDRDSVNNAPSPASPPPPFHCPNQIHINQSINLLLAQPNFFFSHSSPPNSQHSSLPIILTNKSQCFFHKPMLLGFYPFFSSLANSLSPSFLLLLCATWPFHCSSSLLYSAPLFRHYISSILFPLFPYYCLLLFGLFVCFAPLKLNIAMGSVGKWKKLTNQQQSAT